MRRPVSVFCFTGLLAQLAAVCLPQAAFWPLAAFCVLAGMLLYGFRRKSFALVVSLAVLAGSLLYLYTQLHWCRPARALAGQTVSVCAVVTDTGACTIDGMVSATLSLQTANGEPTSVSLYCSCLPDCELGDIIAAKMELFELPDNRQSWAKFADGIFLEGEYRSDFSLTGTDRSLRFTMRRFGRRLSANIRRYLSREEGAILAAMATGDRRFLSARQTALYRRAGIPHILVVSGLHVSALCGVLTSHRSKRRWRVAGAWCSIFLAFFMMGIVGFTPSVTRAGIAALILNLGVLLLQPGDGLTALGIAVFGMSACNAYAVCDVALQLSFAATFGVLYAGEFTRKLLQRPWAQSRWGGCAARFLQNMAIGFGASLCTFPVLVFWGMNVSAVSLLSNLCVLWLAKPLLLFGLLTAVCGLTPLLQPFQRGFGLCGGVLARLLTQIAEGCSSLPGAQLYFKTPYAGIVVLVVIGYAVLLHKLGLPKRNTALATAALAAAALVLGGVLEHNTICVTMLGNPWSPSVVITQNRNAVVLYRGGYYNETKIQECLERYGMEQADWIIDLRYSGGNPCGLQAEHQILALCELDAQQATTFRWQDVEFSLYSSGNGGAVWMDLGGVSAIATSGLLELHRPAEADILLAASARPEQVQAPTVLTLHRSYAWLDNAEADRVYYGQAGLHILVGPHKGWLIGGAEDGS